MYLLQELIHAIRDLAQMVLEEPVLALILGFLAGRSR